MDGSRFDDLTRALARGTSRRRVLKGMAGGLGALAAAVGLRPSSTDAQRLPNGSACTRATQCASLKCADGVCCNAACSGQCEACATGACLPVSGAPVGNRPACTGTDVCQASCDGATRTHCTQYPGLDISCAPGTCEDGFGYTFGCGGDGTCHPLGEDCGLYVCNAGGTACLTTCASDAECVGEAFCLNGACVEDRPLGNPCTADAQCASGICAQGVCCATACPGQCQACNVPGNAGFCAPRPDGTFCGVDDACCDGECVDIQIDLEHCGVCDNACRLLPTPGTCEDDPICLQSTCTFTPLPQGTECRASAGICDPAKVCNGTALTCPPNAFAPPSQVCRPPAAGGCDVAENCTGTSATCPADAFQPNTFVCRPGTCTAGVATPPTTCPGTGPICPASPPTVPCFPYTCNDTGTACRTTCGMDQHCVGNHFCTPQGVCVPDLNNGQACNRPAMCASGNCNVVSDICCAGDCPPDVPCSGPGFTCGCSVDTDCPAPQFCNASNQCQNDFPYNQGPCDRGAQCLTGICNTTTDVCGCNDNGDCQTGQFCCATTLTCDSLACTSVILAGEAGPTDTFGVDDDLFIDLVRGGVIVQNLVVDPQLSLATTFNPVPFTYQPGDQLHIVAIDTGGSAILDRLVLYCATSACLQQVVFPGFVDHTGGSTGTFVDTTVAINIQPI